MDYTCTNCSLLVLFFVCHLSLRYVNPMAFFIDVIVMRMFGDINGLTMRAAFLSVLFINDVRFGIRCSIGYLVPYFSGCFANLCGIAFDGIRHSLNGK